MGTNRIFALLFLSILTLSFQSTTAQKRKDVYVDKEGVMRWGDSKKEVFGFGINYTAPFAHAYRSAKKLDVDLEKAIEQDVYQFARLGFDAFRVHVWDTEISDTVGNLLENDHLRLFDFTVAKMKERGMKMLITPIAFWNNGYPEKDEATPGFAAKYGKDACLVNPEAIKAQEKYLYQFLNHVNEYTGIAYKNDPDVVAFEISNEPHHRGKPAEVKAYINRMEASMRKTGCKKPVFYNVSHSVHLGPTYFDSNISGGTFQWYPTGLGAGHELRGNFLPNVDRYTLPFGEIPAFRSMAKVVYEFDAADVGRSYIYPAIARSFREAGIQWATHFAYDPSFMAYANTEYNTHYMNLLYAPQKALSLKIAGEVFHRIPRYKSFGRYPANTSFDGFRVSYEEDLAEFSDQTKFYYTNSTTTAPANTSTLTEIAGYGNSAVVNYKGRGAYFLDKIFDGVWRLEVYPDAIWVDNVFGKNALDKKVAVLKWNNLPMTINLPDLGAEFGITALANNAKLSADGTSVNVSPGVYILNRKGVNGEVDSNKKLKNFSVKEYGAEQNTLDKTYLVHSPFEQVTEGHELKITADLVSTEEPKVVALQIGGGWNLSTIEMKKTSAYVYEAIIPSEKIKPGFLWYNISVQDHNGKWTTYPSRSSKTPADWDFNEEGYTTKIVEAKSPLYIFNALDDADQVSKEWRPGTGLIPYASGAAGLLVTIPKLHVQDEENLGARPVYDYSMRYNFRPNVAGRKDDLGKCRKLIIEMETVDSNFPIQIALVDQSGYAYGATVEVKKGTDSYEVDFSSLKPVRYVILPRPYPTFLPYFFEPERQGPFNIEEAETIQLSVGPGLNADENTRGFKFILNSVRLE